MVGGAITAACLWGIPVWATSQLHAAGARRGFQLDVGKARIGWLGVRFENVKVRSNGGRADASISALWVNATTGAVVISGATLMLRGAPEELAAEVTGDTNAKAEGGGGREIRGSDITVSWRSGPMEIDVVGAAFERSAHSRWGTADTVTGRWEAFDISADHVKAEFPRTLAPTVSAEHVTVRKASGALAESPSPAGPAGPWGLPSTASLSLAASRIRPLWSALKPINLSAEELVLAPTTDSVLTVRGVAVEVFEREQERVVRLHRAGNDGPGALDVQLTLLAGAHETATIRAKAGPLPLSALGLGVPGVIAPEQAMVMVDLTGELNAVEAFARGRASLSNITLEHPKLADIPVTGLSMDVEGDVRFRERERALDVNVQALRVGGFTLGGSASTKETEAGQTFAIAVKVPAQPCVALHRALPASMLSVVGAWEVTGTFAADVSLSFNTATLDESFSGKILLEPGCRVLATPEGQSIRRFAGRFLHDVELPDGSLQSLELGPETASWAPLEEARWMEVALTTTEDAGFRRHRGFDTGAIVSSIRDNLRERRFFRGASTLTMQLAKNLYLTRKKTIARKLEEAFVTMYLEDELSKDRILELYLNVVEFGPSVYGLRAAAEHYFACEPDALTLAQSFYLATLLPNPRQSGLMADGVLSPGRAAHVRTLLSIAAERGRISDAELAAGLADPLLGAAAD